MSKDEEPKTDPAEYATKEPDVLCTAESEDGKTVIHMHADADVIREVTAQILAESQKRTENLLMYGHPDGAHIPATEYAGRSILESLAVAQERERCARVCESALDAYGVRSDAGAHLLCGVLRGVLARIRGGDEVNIMQEGTGRAHPSEERKHPPMANADEVRELRHRIDGFEDLVLNLRNRVLALEEKVAHPSDPDPRLFGWNGAGR